MTVANEQPFILNLHDVEYPKIRELREKELDLVTGGSENPPRPGPRPVGPNEECTPDEIRLKTYKVTPAGDGGDIKDDCMSA